MSGQNEAQDYGLQTLFANSFPNSSKIPNTEHFLEYFTKFVYDLYVFHRCDPVYNQYHLLPFTMEKQLCGKTQEKHIKLTAVVVSSGTEGLFLVLLHKDAKC